MRIVENSQSRLVLRDRTLWITYVCCSAAVFLFAVFYVGQGDHRAIYPAAIFALFGFAFLRSTDMELDKAARVCRLAQRNMLQVSHRALDFDQITDIRIEYGPIAGNSQVATCRLTFVVGEEVVPLTAAFEGSPKTYETLRDAVVNALWADKSQPAGLDPVMGLVQNGRLADAVRILRLRDGLDLAAATARVAEMRVQTSG